MNTMSIDDILSCEYMNDHFKNDSNKYRLEFLQIWFHTMKLEDYSINLPDNYVYTENDINESFTDMILGSMQPYTENYYKYKDVPSQYWE